jgi:hypothetical protein
MLRALRSADVRFILTGSVAALAYGVAVEPNDLDIAPDLTAENLDAEAASA